ncbi:NAD-dependent epimerase/dehydratase family protein [Xylophilus ampelinus]|uniref:Nucleoside-diphosphate-sugar epimerase n=1 Tax=Xylophilus ampelinus TaxID=54067 RepID=A0A318SXB8_9BURK|nr:NAD-dependent epimerase/dehydratase family protein [Xylophilus ampelinus]MCS4508961.1 sugar nucleotide-binding protein [Xylophilus ampelinus]PYE79527.1 nucleoside-diphosphate-sugar epimerase [Xylophilus ampelinus]
MGALPARFRRTRVLIVGCGDVGLRVAGLLAPRVRLLALTSSPDRIAELRQRGVVPLRGDLDDAASLRRLAGLGQRVLHLAPPPRDAMAADPHADPRTRALLHALAAGPRPMALVYGSTTGVYGDCAGAKVFETRTVAPRNARACRRVDAEGRVRFFGRGSRASILRIPGIYAPDRDGGTPRARLQRGTPVLRADDDVYTNHIHADDLARACCAALWRGAPQRVYHASDATDMTMAAYMDHAADLYGLPRPPRIGRQEAEQHLSAMQMSFLSESRRLVNARLTQELRLKLRYPTIAEGLRSGI